MIALECWQQGVVWWLSVISLGLKWFTLDRETTCETFIHDAASLGWGIHHDEKFAAHDARILALGRAYPGKFADYALYPVSAAFGLGGPLLAALGFKLFGVNNLGLRAVLATVSAVTDYFLLSSFFLLFPPAMAVGMGLCLVLNFSHFTFGRHGVLEHIFLAACAAMFCFWLADPAALAGNAFAVAAGLAALVVFKWSFPVFGGMFLAFLFAASGAGLTAWLWALAGGLAGGAAGFTLQLAGLWRLGLAQAYFLNIKNVFDYHTGRDCLCDHTIKPARWRALPVFFHEFARYHLGFADVAADKTLRRVVLAGLALSALAGAAGLTQADPVIRRTLVFLALFHLAHFYVFFSCFFYLKRLIVVIPFTYIGAGLAVRLACEQAAAAAPWTQPVLSAAGVLFVAYFLYRQALAARAARWLPGDTLARAAAVLTGPVPKGQPIHVHGLAFRMLWRNTTHRITAYDEQFMGTPLQVIIWALRGNARFVIVPAHPEQPLPGELMAVIAPLAFAHIEPEAGDEHIFLTLYEIRPPYHVKDRPILVPDTTQEVLADFYANPPKSPRGAAGAT